ncbi:hypothetical protein SB00617_01835 [Klebsiella pneumoniae]|nr:hypothetical protein SB00617_01835 [Klebsiella pneumoniae]
MLNIFSFHRWKGEREGLASHLAAVFDNNTDDGNFFYSRV